MSLPVYFAFLLACAVVMIGPSPALTLIVAVEALGIDPADAAPDYWHHVRNRLSVNEIPRMYTRSRHQAWLHRRKAAP
jgi:hypothetical protein